jgi:hypothetical protein
VDIDEHLGRGAAADVHIDGSTGGEYQARGEQELRRSYVREIPEFALADGRIIVEVQVGVARGKNASLNIDFNNPVNFIVLLLRFAAMCAAF